MTNTTKLLASVFLLGLTQTGFACDYPDRVVIPDGNSANKDEMLAGRDAVQSYVKNMEEYLACIEEQEKLARQNMDELTPEVEQQREDMLTKKYNAAHDEMSEVAARFNNELQAYNAKAKAAQD